MPVQLYYLPPSPPCRAVMLTAEAIGFEMELIMLNIQAREHLTSEYEQMPVLRKQTDTYDLAQYEKMTEAFRILDKFLEGHDYVTGDHLTIADLALVSSVTTAEAFGFHLDDYENVTNWLEKVQTFAPGYEKANGEPLEIFKKFVEDSRDEKKDEEKEGEEEEKEEAEEENEEAEEENE